MNIKRIGIFGPTLSGKSTLAHELSRQYWARCKIRSLVLDPHVETWGEHAWVTDDEEAFYATAWKTTDSLVIIEETSATIQRAKELIPMFTRLRHQRHHLMVIGHSGMDLLPVMRQQLTTVYLFRQPESAAKVWAENFAQKDLLSCMELQQYEFVHFESYGVPCKQKLKL